MTKPDDLREELARAICEVRYHQAGFPDTDDPAVSQKYWVHYLIDADAVLPIVARAVAAEREACARMLELGVAADSAEYEALAEKADEAFNDAADARKSMNERVAAFVGVFVAAIRARGGE